MTPTRAAIRMAIGAGFVTPVRQSEMPDPCIFESKASRRQVTAMPALDACMTLITMIAAANTEHDWGDCDVAIEYGCIDEVWLTVMVHAH